MNREQRKDLVEAIGLIAIVGSLVFLAMEVRQNTRVQERVMQMERITSYNDMYLNEPAIADIFAKVKKVDGPELLAAIFADRYGLSVAESVIWSRVVTRPLLVIHGQYVSDGPSDQLERELKGLMLYWDFRKAVQLNEDGFLSPEFIDYAKSIIDEM